MANAKEADYKNVVLEEEDIVEMRKAVATGSAKAEVPVNSGMFTCTSYFDILTYAAFAVPPIVCYCIASILMTVVNKVSQYFSPPEAKS